jgi:hypothetical protein
MPWDGRSSRRAAGLCLAATAALLIAASQGLATTQDPARTSGALPLAPATLGATQISNQLQVEPTTIVYTGDGTGFLAGASVRNRKSGIAWTRWTSETALGTGFNQLNNCNPSCAGGKYRGYPVRIELWRPQTLAGTLVFTRMTIFYEKSRPPGQPHHYTFTDIHTADGGYGFGPPGELDYCTHTHGLKPAAGCQNIHSLP